MSKYSSVDGGILDDRRAVVLKLEIAVDRQPDTPTVFLTTALKVTGTQLRQKILDFQTRQTYSGNRKSIKYSHSIFVELPVLRFA